VGTKKSVFFFELVAENFSEITHKVEAKKNQYACTGFFIAFSQKSTAYAVSEKKWLNG